MPRTRPPYPPEFRLEAIRMLRAGVRTPRQLAAELGCAEQTLRNWVRQDEADRGERQDVLMTLTRLCGHLILGVSLEEGGPGGSSREVSARVSA